MKRIYYTIEGPLHRLHPGTKLVVFLIYILTLCLAQPMQTARPVQVIVMLADILFIAICALVGRLPLSGVLRNARWMATAAVISLAAVLLEGKTWTNALVPLFRVCCILCMSSVFTMTTKTGDIACIFGSRGSFPVMVATALHFVPVLSAEAKRIVMAQKSRGAGAKAAVSVILPLFACAYRKAADLADAMQNRLYTGSKGRTRLNRPQFSAPDVFALAFTAVFVWCIVLAGGGSWL